MRKRSPKRTHLQHYASITQDGVDEKLPRGKCHAWDRSIESAEGGRIRPRSERVDLSAPNDAGKYEQVGAQDCGAHKKVQGAKVMCNLGERRWGPPALGSEIAR